MMREEFRRSELLLGPQALERLAGAHAAVFGVGGVGGHAAETLAARAWEALRCSTATRWRSPTSTGRSQPPTLPWGNIRWT